MKIKILLVSLLIPACGLAQEFQLVQQELVNPDNVPAPCHPVPHERQILWNETEFYAFFHYGMNTFTDKEWGFGDEKESIYAPKGMPNPEQWVTSVKAAGMRGGIAVVKHHDGFCLWPTATTTHNMTGAGSEYGRTANIPLLFAQASQKHDMKYGFYISPWDRNSAHYGKDTYVTEVFLKQCEELAEFGSDQFEMWFDGARGGDGYYGGEGGSRNIDAEIYYDIPNLRSRVHRIAPNCVMWGVGGEARWIGNEAGWAGETNWSPENRDYAGENNGMYGTETGWFWLPGESDAKATNKGWFYHDGESPLSPERLFQMYLETVGRNATLILNIPPNKAGVLPDASVNALTGMGDLIRARLTNDFAKSATVTVSETRQAGANRNYEAANMIDGNKETYWATNDGTTEATITLMWDAAKTIRYVELMEYIAKGQRVKKFTVETTQDGVNWTRRATGVQTTTIGYKRIVPLNSSTANSYGTGYDVMGVRITIEDSRACPLISKVSVY